MTILSRRAGIGVVLICRVSVGCKYPSTASYTAAPSGTTTLAGVVVIIITRIVAPAWDRRATPPYSRQNRSLPSLKTMRMNVSTSPRALARANKRTSLVKTDPTTGRFGEGRGRGGARSRGAAT